MGTKMIVQKIQVSLVLENNDGVPMDTSEDSIDVKVIPVPAEVDEDKNKVEEDHIPLPPNPTSHKNEKQTFLVVSDQKILHQR